MGPREHHRISLLCESDATGWRFVYLGEYMIFLFAFQRLNKALDGYVDRFAYYFLFVIYLFLFLCRSD